MRVASRIFSAREASLDFFGLGLQEQTLRSLRSLVTKTLRSGFTMKHTSVTLLLKAITAQKLLPTRAGASQGCHARDGPYRRMAALGSGRSGAVFFSISGDFKTIWKILLKYEKSKMFSPANTWIAKYVAWMGKHH